VLATRGPHFKPRLVRALRDPATRKSTPRPPEPLPTIELKDPGSWQVIVDAMVAVTTGPRGTAVRAARGATYSIAGKTGTAQVYTVGQQEKYDVAAPIARAVFDAFLVPPAAEAPPPEPVP
jgi:penicillin-binding protein 2